MSALPLEMISIREFARRDGCSEKRVRNAIQTRHLPTFPGKMLPANLAGTGWREGNRRAASVGADSADGVRTVRSNQAEESAPTAELLPSEACSLSAIVDGGAQEVAALLLRLGHPQAAVAGYVGAWHGRMRAAAVDCLFEDVPPPAGHATWSDHPLFTGSWLEGSSWPELEPLVVGGATDAP